MKDLLPEYQTVIIIFGLALMIIIHHLNELKKDVAELKHQNKRIRESLAIVQGKLKTK